MTLQQLEYIVALDNHRHFVNAAESCFVTQPTLTLQIKKLEEEMGTLIFDRTKHPIEPTHFGELILIKARQILREASQLKELVNQEKDSFAGTYRIGVIPTLAPYLMPLFLPDFIHKYPEVSLVVQEMESEIIIEALKNDLLDVGLLVTPLDESSIREIPLFNEPFLVYASERHPFFNKSKIRASDISVDGLWLLNQGHCFRNQVLNICNNAQGGHLTDNLRYESGSIETLKNMVKSNMGYTLVPELSVLKKNNDSMVKRFEQPEPIREVSLVVHKSFTKETFIEKFGEAILSKIPDSFQKSKRFVKVKWR